MGIVVGATANSSLVLWGHDRSGGGGITGSMIGSSVGIGSACGCAGLDWSSDGVGCWLVVRLARHGASWSDGSMLYLVMAFLMVFGESKWAKNLSV